MTAGVETSATIPASGKPDAAAPTPRPKRRWEAADTVVAASAALVAVIVGIFIFLCVQGYSSTIENTKERGQTAADIVAEGTRWVFSSAATMLDGIAASIGNDPANASAATVAGFESITSTIPAELDLAIYDATGNVTRGVVSASGPASIAETDYFAAVVGGADWALSAQEKNEATGEATFAVVKRLENNGTFTGVAKIAISADVLQRFAEPQDLGEGATVSIVRDDGWVIARHPSLTTPLNLSGGESFQQLNAGETGSYISQASPVDGVRRIVSFRHVEDLGYIALASLSLDTAIGNLWNSIWIVSLLIAPIAAALLVGSLLTARLLRRTQSTSRSLANALEHNETLFREIHHRVKNNLQSVNSLLQLQPIPREVRKDMSMRIAAMSAVHEHIYRSNTFAQVWVKDYLHTLIGNIRAGNDPNVEVIEELEDVAVDKDAATPLGLIVNEVVSNSFKHAFADGRAAKVHISLVPEGDGFARLTVRDNGVGFDPAVPTKGIGRRLIDGFTAQVQGQSTHTSDDGSVFTLTFPLARN